MTAMSKYLEVDQNKVVLNPHRPGKIFCLACTFLYLLTAGTSICLAIILVTQGHFPLTPLCALAFWTAVWAFLMREYNCRIIFDGDDRKIYRRTALGFKELMDFSGIGGITPVSQTSQGCDAGTYYAVTPKGDRYGKGIRISADMYDKDLNAFERDDLPKLFELLESHSEAVSAGDKATTRRLDASGLPEDTVCFRRDGHCFIRLNLLRLATLAAVFAAMLILAASAAQKGEGFLMVAGVVAILSFLAPVKMILDADERTIRQVWGWGLLKRSYPFDHFSHFNTTRQSVNFIPVGTHFSMVMENPEKPGVEKKIQIGYGFSSKKFDRLAEEIGMVLGGGVDGGNRE